MSDGPDRSPVERALAVAGNLARREQRRLARRTRWAAKLANEGVKDSLHAGRHAGESVRDGLVNTGKDLYKKVRRPLREARRRRSQLQEQRRWFEIEWQVEKELEAIVSRGRTLVVGPWLSEVGYEALYWVPFLRWVTAAFRIDPGRVVAVSRGGVASWYEGVASRYVEIWEHLDPADFARRNAERGETKQHTLSALDRDVLTAVTGALGHDQYDVLHPSLMYRLFTLFWSGQRPMSFMDSHLRYARQAAPAIIDPALLPRDYVAVKFYSARSLPDTPAIRSLLRHVVGALSERMPVVLLDTGLVLDEHGDYELASGGRVVSARAWMTPQTNLGVQTQIIAGARAFVGTCGSIAWLAPRLGVDTSAVHVDPKWLHAHIALALRAFHRLGAGEFAVADLRAIDPLGAVGSLRSERAEP